MNNPKINYSTMFIDAVPNIARYFIFANREADFTITPRTYKWAMEHGNITDPEDITPPAVETEDGFLVVSKNCPAWNEYDLYNKITCIDSCWLTSDEMAKLKQCMDETRVIAEKAGLTLKILLQRFITNIIENSDECRIIRPCSYQAIPKFKAVAPGDEKYLEETLVVHYDESFNEVDEGFLIAISDEDPLYLFWLTKAQKELLDEVLGAEPFKRFSFFEDRKNSPVVDKIIENLSEDPTNITNTLKTYIEAADASAYCDLDENSPIQATEGLLCQEVGYHITFQLKEGEVKEYWINLAEGELLKEKLDSHGELLGKGIPPRSRYIPFPKYVVEAKND
jgi:hypothetical protein